jgi:hypothetical protein
VRIFISWSGRASHEAARVLRDTLPTILPDAEIRLWDDSVVEANVDFEPTLRQAQMDAQFAIACVTRENQGSAWLNFEMGFFAARLGRARVAMILVDLQPSMLAGPLKNFRSFSIDSIELRELVGQIWELGSANEASKRGSVEEVFKVWGPALTLGLGAIRRESRGASHAYAAESARTAATLGITDVDALQAIVTRGSTEEAIEGAIVAAVRASGAKVVRRASDRSLGADLAVWSDQLDDSSPVLIEVKRAIEDGGTAQQVARQTAEYVQQAGANRILIVYNEGLDPTILNVNYGRDGIVFLRLPDLLESLRREPLDAVVARETRH